MLESRDIDKLYRCLRDELEYCVLPGYVNAVYRALVYVDCSMIIHATVAASRCARMQ